MKVTFADAALEALCRNSKLATRKLGAQSAGKLQRRLAELLNAEMVAELVAGRPHPLAGNRCGCFALDLNAGHRLIFKPAQQPPPAKPDGAIDWSRVTEITIVELGDYHG